MTFEYDTNGQPAGFSYQNAHYYYLTNQLGDVIGITDVNGYAIVYYLYDEWGNLLSIETADESKLAIAEANPLRYRGYYYDTETEYYYLQSRHYDAEICRFINADEPIFLKIGENITKWNLYSYCDNDPIKFYDPMGTITLLACVIIGTVVGAAAGALLSKMIYGKVNGWWVLGGAIVGGVLGYVGGAFFGASGIKAGTLASKIKMSKIRWLGKIGEKLSKLPKNTQRIQSITKTAKYRIPDYLDTTNKIIGDVKNVKQLSYTKQIQDFMLYAEKYGYTFVLKVRKTTQLSNALKALVDAGKIVIWYL